MAASDYTALVQQFYIGFYGRPADKAGLDWWANEVDGEGGDFSVLLDAFATSDEAQEFVYNDAEGNPYTNTELVTNIYNVLLERDPDTDGLDFYVAGLEDGSFTLQSVVKNIIDGAQEGSTDRKIIDNKVTVAEKFTSSLKDDTTYDDTNIDDARAVIADVDATDESVTDAEALADQFVEKNTPGTGETFVLTTDTDVIEGTVGDDTIDGVSSSLSSEKTLNAADQIDGGEGTDTLDVTMKGSFSGFSGDGKLENVENVKLTSDSNIARDFDATGVTGVEKYTIDATKSAVNLKDLGDLDATIALSDQAKGSFTVAYATDVTKGTADAQALAFTNVGTVKDSANSIAEAAVTTTIAGVEELTLDVSGDNVADFTAANTKTVTVTGDGSLKMASGPAALKTLDASEASGDLNINLTASTDATTASLGSGDDTLTVGAGNVTKNAELSGGDGEDTLKLSATGTVQYIMSGFETVNLANTAGALTYSAANTSDIETIQVNKAMTSNATFASLGSGDYTVELLGKSAGTPTVTLDHTGSTTINVTDPASTADTNAASVTATESATVDMTVDEKMEYTGTVTASKASSVELDIQGEVDGATISAGEATSVVITAVENASDFTLTAGKATDLNVTAAEDLDLAAAPATLTKLEALTVNTDGDFDLSGTALAAISTVTVEGTGSVELQKLGDIDQDGYAITLNATGLSSDETSGTQSLKVGTIDTEGQKITVDASGVLGKVTVGAIDADNGAAAGSAGDVTIDLDGVGDDFILGAIDGNTVTIDAEGALGTTNTFGNVTLDQGGSLDFTGVNLAANAITANATGSEDITMTFVGGIDNDTFTVTTDGLTAFTGDLTIDATGAIQATGGKDTLSIDSTNDALDVDSLNLSGIEVVKIAGSGAAGNAITLDADDTTGESFILDAAVAADRLTIEGTASADTIDLSGITSEGYVTAAGVLVVKGGGGADTITGSGATDIFTYTATTEGGDTINEFNNTATYQNSAATATGTQSDAFAFVASEFAYGQDTGTLLTAAAAVATTLVTGASLTAIEAAIATGSGGNLFGVFAYDTDDNVLYYLTGNYTGSGTSNAASVLNTVTVATIDLTGASTFAATDIVLV